MEVNSILKFFSLRGQYELNPNKHYAIDDIDDYVAANSSINATISEFRFIKHQLQQEIRVDLNNISITDYSLSPSAQARNYNYVGIKNYTVDDNNNITYLDSRWIYYFIVDRRFVAQETAYYTLEMDTLNSILLSTDYSFSDKTYITREHEDRWKRVNTDPANTYRRVIDIKNEGLNPPKYVIDEKVIKQDSSDLKWYLIAKNTSSIDPQAVAVPLSNPVKLLICASEEVQVYSPHSFYHVLDQDEWAIFLKNDFAYIDIRITRLTASSLNLEYDDEIIGYGVHDTGSYYSVVSYRIDPNDNTRLEVVNTYQCASVEVSTYAVSNSIFYRIVTTAAPDYPAPLVISTITGYTLDEISLTNRTCISINSRNYNSTFKVDRTNPQLIKIIELPYCPITMLNNKLPPNAMWNDTEKMIEYDPSFGSMSSDIVLTGSDSPASDIQLTSISPLYTTSKDDFYESKLYSSEFYLPKIVYDSFSFDIELEKMYDSPIPFFVINFAVSGTTASKFLLRIASYNTKYAVYNYNKILSIARNNEIPIYNIAYLNYLKTGYNYDLKNKALQNTKNAIGIGSGMLGTAGAIMSGNPAAVGMAAFNVATSIVGGIISNIQMQNTIEQKLIEAANQGANISSSDDVDLLKFYADDNKAKTVYYDVSNAIKNLVFSLFYYTGYIQNKYAIPNITSRTWFNYIQCEPVFNVINPNVSDVLMDDLKQKYREGVTVFHCHTVSSIKTWDLAQEKENWEVIFPVS